MIAARKRPILIFTGDHDGTIVKWEQMQSNNFMYSNEAFVVTELMLKKMTKVCSKHSCFIGLRIDLSFSFLISCLMDQLGV